jgi:hypothetical protein
MAHVANHSREIEIGKRSEAIAGTPHKQRRRNDRLVTECGMRQDCRDGHL